MPKRAGTANVSWSGSGNSEGWVGSVNSCRCFPREERTWKAAFLQVALAGLRTSAILTFKQRSGDCKGDLLPVS